MSLEELFKKPVILPGTASQRLRRQISKLPVQTVSEKPYEKGCDYASKYIKEEEKLYMLKHDGQQASIDDHASISEVESLSNPTSRMSISMEDQGEIYIRYPRKRHKPNDSLPIFEQKREILDYIKSRKVLIIKGATGCGKTTQVPQFILNAAREIRQHCNIVVTQPRRIAAISVAKRVADELDVSIGSLVGYQVGLERKVSDDTRLLYCTTGVLLQKLINQKSLHEFTHIILDEIHERDQDMDFLLLVVRKLLNTVSRDTRVILMSATIETGIFSEYFFTLVNGNKMGATVVDISESNKYLVRKAFLDDIKDRIPETHGITLDLDNPQIERRSYLTAVRLIQFFDDIDDAENQDKGREAGARGSVLVFLPGLHEIEEMDACLRSKKNDTFSRQNGQYLWKIIPLHSTITHEEQKSVFLPVETGHRKIILSTNIAESSITVVDIDYVIDFCLTKTMVTDRTSNFCHLKLEWASKSNLDQRAGRVGRVSNGRVFRLITESFYAELDQEPTPEILRCPLDQLVLQAKLLDMGEPRAIFALALDQPHLENIEYTILTLKEIGALLVTTNREITPFDGDLTRMGLVMAKLPLDVRLSKLIFFGNLFDVLKECIVIACALSVKNVFCQPFREYLRSYNMKLFWADSSCSDCIAFYHAYKVWRKRCTEGAFRKGRRNALEWEWAREHFVELRTLKDIAVLEKEIENRLKHSGITLRTESQDIRETPKRALFIKLAIAAAFYPQYFFRGSQGGHVDEKDAVITLGGHDPFTTVYLQGMPPNQPSILYKQFIQQKFSECSNRANVFVDSSSKVFVQFGRSEEAPSGEGYRMQIPGKISLTVYQALKMRQQPDFKFRIPVLNPIDASTRYQLYVERCETMGHDGPRRNPVCDDIKWPWNKDAEQFDELLEVHISYIVSPNRFWAQSRYSRTVQLLYKIVVDLNLPDVLEPLNGLPRVGRLYAATFEDDGCSKFYRCRILSVNQDGTCDIYFVDYGNTILQYDTREILDFGRDLVLKKKIDAIPDLAVECSLAKLRPRSSHAGEGNWSPKAVLLMKSENESCVRDNLVMAVYSFVNNVANVKLKMATHSQSKCFNDLLIRRGLAEKCEESYLSIIDHEERKRMRTLVNTGDRAIGPLESRNRASLSSKSDFLEQDLQPRNNECSQEIVLRGPFSPLEMRIYGGTQRSIGKLVRIESTSVNSVLLDTNPSDTHERMVVSSFVTTNESGDRLTLRSTTVMPNLPGLPALVCLMFAPMVELRSNNSFTKLSGALCGLGRDPRTGRSLFEDNDIELIFDVELTLDDIAKINRIRFWLNRAVCVSDKTQDEEAGEIRDCKNKLIEYISGVLEKRYELQELNFFENAYKWGETQPEYLICPCSDNLASLKNPGEDFPFVYRLIWGIRLDGDSSTETTAVIKNMQQLRNFALGQTSVKNMECILCRITLSNATNAKLHLKSAQHKIRQKRFNIPDELLGGSCANLSEYR